MSSPSISVETVSSTDSSQKRQRTSKSSPVRRTLVCSVARRVTKSTGNTDRRTNGVPVLLNLEEFICLSCLESLTGNLYQCSNGHTICSKCYIKGRPLCAVCRTPTPPLSRNLAMEGVLKVVRVPCPNAEFGCSEYLPYDDVLDQRSAHLERCLFTQCPCPFRNCEFTGSYMELYQHSATEHENSLKMFKCGKLLTISFANDDRVVLKEMSEEGGELVVVDRFNVEGNTMITSTISAKCIAPKVPGRGNFSCSFCIITPNRRLSSNCVDMERVPGVTAEFLNGDNWIPVLTQMDRDSVIKICIKRKAFGNPGTSTSSARLV